MTGTAAGYSWQPSLAWSWCQWETWINSRKGVGCSGNERSICKAANQDVMELDMCTIVRWIFISLHTPGSVTPVPPGYSHMELVFLRFHGSGVGIVANRMASIAISWHSDPTLGAGDVIDLSCSWSRMGIFTLVDGKIYIGSPCFNHQV